MKKINLQSLNNNEHLVQPEEFHEVNIHSPAMTVFTDFKQHQPRMIEADTPVVQAAFLMKKAHVRLLLVVDKAEELVGTISLQELDAQHLQVMQEKHVHRLDMTVADVMIPRSQLNAIPYQALNEASIRDVIITLQSNGKLHCLVVDEQTHQIRGIVAASDIARRLHVPVKIEHPTSFIDIFDVMNKGTFQLETTQRYANVANF
jgi:CBS domain-containing protein